MKTETKEQSNDANQNIGRDFKTSTKNNHTWASKLAQHGRFTVTNAPTKNRGGEFRNYSKLTQKIVAITTKVHEWQFEISNSKPNYIK